MSTTETMELHRAQITKRARTAKPAEVGLLVLTVVVMGIPWLLGWLAGVAWFLAAWVVSAAIEGGQAGWKARPGVTAPPG